MSMEHVTRGFLKQATQASQKTLAKVKVSETW